MVAIYNADVWCDECAKKIKESIAKKYALAMLVSVGDDFTHSVVPLNPMDSHTEVCVEELAGKLIDWLDDRVHVDSDDWPSCGHPTEPTDGPQHCGCHEGCETAEELSDGTTVSALLGTELTEHGVNYLNEMLGEPHEKTTALHEFWREQFDSYDLIPDPDEEDNDE